MDQIELFKAGISCVHFFILDTFFESLQCAAIFNKRNSIENKKILKFCSTFSSFDYQKMRKLGITCYCSKSS